MTDGKWLPVLELMQTGDFGATLDVLDQRLASEPFDSAGRMLRAVAAVAQGDIKAAEIDLWRALAISPTLPGARAALGDLFIRDLTVPPPRRDFSLASGERQTAEDIAGIRQDHRCRYEFAALWLRDALAPAHHVTGIDLFCGNGYGSRILANLSGCRVVGVDGSSEAIALAERAYGGHRVVFRPACFPFEMTPDALDFAVCFESVEHVDDPEALLRALDTATQGPIVLSFPLESALSFAVNADLFRHHTRHFSLAEIEDILVRDCRRRISLTRGQTVYQLKGDRLDGLVPDERMSLTALRDDSQFAVIVAERA